MSERRIDVTIPDEDFQRLRRWKNRTGRTWAGVLVAASRQLPDEAEVKG